MVDFSVSNFYTFEQLFASGAQGVVFKGIRSASSGEQYAVILKCVPLASVANLKSEVAWIGKLKDSCQLLEYFQTSGEKILQNLRQVEAGLNERLSGNQFGVFVFNYLQGEPIIDTAELLTTKNKANPREMQAWLPGEQTDYWITYQLKEWLTLEKKFKLLETLTQFVIACKKAGQVHRDLSPLNILFDPKADQIFILDPGGSQSYGTPGWQSQEQVELQAGFSGKISNLTDCQALSLMVKRLLDSEKFPGKRALFKANQKLYFEGNPEDFQFALKRVLTFFEMPLWKRLPIGLLVAMVGMFATLFFAFQNIPEPDIVTITKSKVESHIAEAVNLPEHSKNRLSALTDLRSLYHDYPEYRNEIVRGIAKLQGPILSKKALSRIAFHKPDLLFVGNGSFVLYGYVRFRPGDYIGESRIIWALEPEQLYYIDIEDNEIGKINFHEHPIERGPSQNTCLIWDMPLGDLTRALGQLNYVTVGWLEEPTTRYRARFTTESLHELWNIVCESVYGKPSVEIVKDDEIVWGKMEIQRITKWTMEPDHYEIQYYPVMYECLSGVITERAGYAIGKYLVIINEIPSPYINTESSKDWFVVLNDMLENYNLKLEYEVIDQVGTYHVVPLSE